MKTFTFLLDPHPFKTHEARLKKALETGIPDIQRDSTTCRTVDVMMSFMTKSKMQIFAAIIEQSPESISELARILGKDLGNVSRDVQGLESLGIIKLKAIPGGGRDKLKPIALYQRIAFECHSPKKKEAI